MQEPTLQFAVITLLLILSVAGLVYVVRTDILLSRYEARVKRQDVQFWLAHHAAFQLDRMIKETLEKRNQPPGGEDFFKFKDSPIKPPYQRWKRARDRGASEGYDA
jgi:hypothetical protein